MKIYSNNILATDSSNLTSGFQLISFDFQIHAQKDPQFTRALQWRNTESQPPPSSFQISNGE
jgi:hypothetical protein